MPKSLSVAVLEVAALLPIDDPTVQRRLDRAEQDILQGYGYSITASSTGTGYVIHKASTTLLEDNSHSYHVTQQSCDCPDFEVARAHLCKHRLAVMILEVMRGEGAV